MLLITTEAENLLGGRTGVAGGITVQCKVLVMGKVYFGWIAHSYGAKGGRMIEGRNLTHLVVCYVTGSNGFR